MGDLKSFLIGSKLPFRSKASDMLINRILADKYTMGCRARLLNLKKQVEDLCELKGSLVECGVAQGGCLAIMRYFSKPTTKIWGFDSFEGMPKLTDEDESDGDSWVGHNCSVDGQQAVHSAFDMLGVCEDNVQLVKGWFEDTLEKSKADIGPISILRLDNDWYKSTMYCLDTLYDSVLPGGAVIIDDYYTFKGCRKAVDQFREKVGEDSPLIVTQKDSEVYWLKSG